MALFGGSKKESYLGIDIGAGGIKLVELSNEKGRAKLMTYAYSVRKPGEAASSPFENPKATGEAIARMVQQSGAKSTRVMAALPPSSVFSAIISVPRKKDEKEMKPLVDAEVGKLTPLPLAEMITYSTFIDEIGEKKGEKDKKGEKPGKDESGSAGGEKKSDYVRVLVTGASKNLVQKYIEIFRVAKLDLQAIDTEAFALVRSLIGKDKSAIALLDIGTMRTNITIVEKGIPFLTRSIQIGGATVTRRIMDQMGIPEEEAEQVKVDLASLGGDTAGAGLPAVLETVMQPVLNEVQYAFQLYSKMEHKDLSKVEKIVVTGGSSLLPRVPEFLAEALDMNVYRGDPWARVAVPADLRPVLEEIGPKMSVAIGLAMREIE